MYAVYIVILNGSTRAVRTYTMHCDPSALSGNDFSALVSIATSRTASCATTEVAADGKGGGKERAPCGRLLNDGGARIMTNVRLQHIRTSIVQADEKNRARKSYEIALLR